MQVKEYIGACNEIFRDKGLIEAIKAFSELFNLKSFLSSPLGAFGLGATSLYAGYKAFKAADNTFGLTYEGAFNKTNTSLKNVQDTKSEIDDLQAKVDDYKESLQQIAINNDRVIPPPPTTTKLVQKPLVKIFVATPPACTAEMFSASPAADKGPLTPSITIPP